MTLHHDVALCLSAPLGLPEPHCLPSEIGVFGDMPDGAYGREHFQAVLADMNRTRLQFSVFVGDTKNGSDPCCAEPHPVDPADPTPENAVADAAHPDVYKAALGAFNSLRRPLVHLPGDNEWTDCDRTTITDGRPADSSDRLAYLRTMSYPDDRSLGKHPLHLTRQSASYPENVRWQLEGVTFIGLNIPGQRHQLLARPQGGRCRRGAGRVRRPHRRQPAPDPYEVRLRQIPPCGGVAIFIRPTCGPRRRPRSRRPRRSAARCSW